MTQGPESRTLLTEVKQEKGKIIAAGLNQDGSHLVSVNGQGAMRVWERPRNGSAARLLTDGSGHDQAVESARFSPDGRRLLTVSKDSLVRMRESPEGRIKESLLAEVSLPRQGYSHNELTMRDSFHSESSWATATISPEGLRLVHTDRRPGLGCRPRAPISQAARDAQALPRPIPISGQWPDAHRP